MSLTRKIVHNTIYQIIGRGIGLVISLISLSLITRYLGVAMFGSYITILTFLQVFSIIVDFGLTLMSVQMISEIDSGRDVAMQRLYNGTAQEKINNIFSNIFTLRLTLAIIFFALASAVVWMFPYSTQIKYGVLIVSAGFLFISLGQILQGVFQKNLQMGKTVIADLANRLVFLAGVYLAMAKNWNLYGILFFVVISNFINFILMFYWSRQFAQIRIRAQYCAWKKIISRSWPLALSIIFNLIYLKMDILILSLYYGQRVVGIYGAAYRAIDVLTVFPYLFVGLILPILSSAWARQDIGRFNQILQSGFEVLTIVATPLVVGTIFLAEPIMILIAGQEFSGSGKILKILIIALGMIYLGNVHSHSIIALNKQKKMMWGYLFVAVSSLIGYFIFIPLYSYWGAAWVTLYSETAVMIISILMVGKTINRWPNLTVLVKSGLASLGMAFFLWLSHGWSLFIIGPLAAVVYFGLMLAMKGINKGLIAEVLNVYPQFSNRG